MACVHNLHLSSGARFPEYHGGKVLGHGAFAEDAVGARHLAIEWKPAGCQCPEDGAQVRREHRCGNSLSGDIAQDEEEAGAICLLRNYIAMVPAHWSQGLVVVSDLPAVLPEVLFREQFSLNVRCQVQILFQRVLLVRREVGQTVADQGIDPKLFGLDRLVARFADPVGPVVDSFQSRVHLPEKVLQTGIFPASANGVLEPPSSVQ